MIIAKCRNCGNPIPKFNKVNSLYCSDYCRKAFYDINKRKTNKLKVKKSVLSIGKGVPDND